MEIEKKIQIDISAIIGTLREHSIKILNNNALICRVIHLAKCIAQDFNQNY